MSGSLGRGLHRHIGGADDSDVVLANDSRSAGRWFARPSAKVGYGM